jgi:hypothetical protein
MPACLVHRYFTTLSFCGLRWTLCYMRHFALTTVHVASKHRIRLKLRNFLRTFIWANSFSELLVDSRSSSDVGVGLAALEGSRSRRRMSRTFENEKHVQAGMRQPSSLVFSSRGNHKNHRVRSEVFTAVNMKNAVFWDMAPCRSCVNRRFGWTYRFSLQGLQSASACSRWFFARGLFYPEDGGDTFLRHVDSHKIYTASYPRRRHSS